jgi:hypothetical protein
LHANAPFLARVYALAATRPFPAAFDSAFALMIHRTRFFTRGSRARGLRAAAQSLYGRHEIHTMTGREDDRPGSCY